MTLSDLPRPRYAFALISVLHLASCKPADDCDAPTSDSPAFNAGVTRGPQVALLQKDSVLLAWETEKPGPGAVEYGKEESLGQRADASETATAHTVRLEGLEPGTRYFYRVLVEGQSPGTTRSFATVPADPASPTRFAVFGDSGSGCKEQAVVASAVADADPDFVLHAGDAIYDTGAPSAITPKYFVPYAHLVDGIPFYVALGNHDIKTDNGEPLLDALYLPVNDVDGTESFYSFDRGNMHVVALNSNSGLEEGSAQIAWLEKDLSSTTAEWKFVFFHHPPYSSSNHGSDRRVQSTCVPLFDAHHVDVVFSGHDHDYERTFPLREGKVSDSKDTSDYTDPAGTVYIVSGTGGKELYSSGRSFFTAASRSVHGFVSVDVEGHRLTLQAVRTDGSVFDEMTITKTPPPEPPPQSEPAAEADQNAVR